MKNILALCGVIGLMCWSYKVGKEAQADEEKLKRAREIDLRADIREFMATSDKEEMKEALDRIYKKLDENK